MAYRKYEQMAPITYLSRDDPPVWMNYTFRNVPVDRKSDLGLVVHHPLFGIDLQERMKALGLECIVQYVDPAEEKQIRHEKGKSVVTVAQFIKRHFERAKAAAGQ